MIKTYLVSMHGQIQGQDNVKYPGLYNIVGQSDSDELLNSLLDESNPQSFISTLKSVNSTLIVSKGRAPIRFKLQDNDDQDLSYPLAIPSQQNVTYYSFRKQLKLLFVSDTQSELQPITIKNLRFYVDTGQMITDVGGNQIQTLGEGITLQVRTSVNYIPPSIDDVTNGLNTQEDNNTQNQSTPLEDQLTFTVNNPLMLTGDNIVWTSDNLNIQITGSTESEKMQNFVQRWFGIQPYVYLTVGLSSNATPKNYSFTIYFVYDEI